MRRTADPPSVPLPGAGAPAGLLAVADPVKATTYFVDYQGVRFIVLDGTAAQVTGTIKDLSGKSEILTFKQITEKGAIYYLAPYNVPQQEVRVFTINVEAGGKAHGFQFNQELFPAE